MSILTKIVKSFAVVDDRPLTNRLLEPEMRAAAKPVIKRSILGGEFIDAKKQPRDQQSYLDEFNRLKVEIARAKAEVKSHKRELEEIQRQVAEAEAFLEPGVEEDELLERARHIQDQAKAEAREIVAKAVAEAQERAEELRNQGYLEGFNKGFEEARKEYIDTNQPQAELLGNMIGRIADFERSQLANCQEELVRLVLAVANKVVCKEIETTPETVVDMLYQTLDHNKREEFIKIVLAKDLLPVETKASEEIRALLENLGANISVYVDGDLQPGDCVVETPKGFTDISISTQLNNIGEALLTEE